MLQYHLKSLHYTVTVPSMIIIIAMTTAPTPIVEGRFICANSSNLTTLSLSWMVR